jgi:hypothetical protein
MFSKDDNSLIWVEPEHNHSSQNKPMGTFTSPFSIQGALINVKPGQKIVLLPGNYTGDINIEISGTTARPVRICSYEKHSAVISRACWFLYDSSDIILSGLAFRDSPLGAIAVVGKCCRNRFEEISFVNCGSGNKTASTLFFGGSGIRCNVVEACTFARPQRDFSGADPAQVSIGLMMSDGRSPDPDMPEGEQANLDQVFRKNSFTNYDCGIMVGSLDSTDFENGTIVEYNSIVNCPTGISVKSGDTCVRGNVVQGSSRRGVAVLAGRGSLVEANRIVDCATGIAARGKAHSIINNCIIRSRE